LVAAATLLALSACGGDKHDRGSGQSGAGGGNPSGSAASGSAANGAAANGGGTNAFGNADGGPPVVIAPHDSGILPNPGACGHLEVRNLDLLFMVDDSRSMIEEQASLRREFPKMIRVLTTGDRDGDGKQDFPPIAQLHLGVVSSDLGAPGVPVHGCEGTGDDGMMNHVPDLSMSTCKPGYPSFLTFTAGVDDPQQAALDFACIASLGTNGCGYEEQLESPLKALWPSSDPSIMFLTAPDAGLPLGQGDRANAGFLRPAGTAGTSLLAVVLVSDEDDCSARDTQLFTPKDLLDPADPLAAQGLNVRCHFNPDSLYPIERYVDGLRALRPASENLVVFGAIVGVPPELVTRDRLAAVSFDDSVSVEAFYQSLLLDPAMQETVDDKGTPEPDDDEIKPSCMTANGEAAPPRRIVEVAHRFGKNGIVQSICQDDFGPAMDAIVLAITRAAEKACVVM
jgi:hypothetical protein